MSRLQVRNAIACVMAVVCFCFLTVSAFAQAGSEGKINVTVVDPQGAVIVGAKLTLVDQATNTSREATTATGGAYSFVNLTIGNYKLTVAQAGFASQELDVVVQASKSTDLTLHLAVGAQMQTVQVEAVAPLLETSTNAIGQVIDPKQIETLPVAGRNLTQLSRMAPGYSGGSGGLWNGLPTYAQGNNVDGVVGSPSRMKFGGNAGSSIAPRLENMEEMTVQVDQLDQNQGFGQAAMQIGYITRRGGNAWHGRAYEDFRNDDLNANNWSNNARLIKRPEFKLNDFGGSIGGPILKNKLFFFASLATSRQPGAAIQTNNVLTAAAQAGNFTYVGTDGVTRTVNVLTTARNYNASLPNTVNATMGTQLGKINSALGSGVVSTTNDPIVNTLSFGYAQPIKQWYPTLRLDYNMNSRIRMNLALNRTLRESPGDTLPAFPQSDIIATTGAGNRSDAATAGYGLDWTITPRLVNQLKVGWLYNASFFAFNSNHGYNQYPFEWACPIVNCAQAYPRPINTYYPNTNIADTLNWQKSTHNFQFGYSFVREHDHYWNGPEGIGTINFGLVSGDPALDALTNAGAYTPLPFVTSTAQTEAQNLYAMLTGRVSSITGLYPFSIKTQDYFHGVGAFPLNEVASSWGLFMQDQWRLRPNLTVNYGLRWDFTGDDYDLTSEYHNAAPDSIFGPTAPGDVFQPGKLNGNLNPTLDARPHAYHGWNVSPQPSLGFAWNPSFTDGILGKLVGKDQTVLRGGYNLRRYSLPYQYVWNYASNCGSFYYQNFALTASTAGGTGNFTPGSVALGATLPAYAITPAAFQKSAPESQFTFTAGSGGSCGINVTGIKDNIAQPYVQSWNLGIQRSLGKNRVFEIRYAGNRTLHDWTALNTNEVNIFENGFLQEFKNAQANMAVCQANSAACLAAQAAAGVTAANQTTANFANWGLSGQSALPILTAAFTGSRTGAQTNAQFRNTTFTNPTNGYLPFGQAGVMAGRMTTVGVAPYFCNLVGNSYSPCARLFPTIAGAGFPINFFQANPYATRQGSNVGATAFMTDSGYSNYNSLQMDFRQQNWHGMQFDANYTWSKSMGILAGGSGNDWLGNYTTFSLRNLRDSYLPTAYDVHHVVHVNATADLPFGRGKRFANKGGVLDRIVGGWNVGSVVTWQSGFPFRLTGGYSTFNSPTSGPGGADSGLILKNGTTIGQLQSAIGVHKIPGAAANSPALVLMIDPKYLNVSNPACLTTWDTRAVSAGGLGCSIIGLNTNYIDSNTVPGTYNRGITLWGPHGFFQDMMLTKNVNITERVRFNFQSVFLNAWNHPVFGNAVTPIGGNPRSAGIFSTSNPPSTGDCYAPCGVSRNGSFGRQIELRANIIF